MRGFFLGLFSFILFFLSANIFADTYTIKQKLNNFIIDQQFIYDDNEKLNGTWPIKIISRDNKQLVFNESDIFFPLQTALSLYRTNQFFSVKEFSKMNARLYAQTQKYFLDTQASHRTFGSISFWPLIEIAPRQFIHNFSAEKETLEIFDHIDLPNDMDTSSRYFLWLAQQNKNHEFIDGFITMSPKNIDEATGAYKTWVHNSDQDLPNNIDCVVNLNVIAALESYEKISGKNLPQKNKSANDSACHAVNQMMQEENILSCSLYYDRLSQLTMAYALAYKEAPDCLADSLDKMYEVIALEAWRIINERNPKDDELSEIIISLAHLPRHPRSVDPMYYSLLKILRKGLKYKLIKGPKFAHAKSSSAFIGTFSSGIFDWYSTAYSTGIALEALSIPIK